MIIEYKQVRVEETRGAPRTTTIDEYLGSVDRLLLVQLQQDSHQSVSASRSPLTMQMAGG